MVSKAFDQDVTDEFLDGLVWTSRMDSHPYGIAKAYLKYMSAENFDEMSKDIIKFINANAKYERDANTLRTFAAIIVIKACKEHSFIKFAVRLSSRIAKALSNDIKDESLRDESGEMFYGANLFREYLSSHVQTAFEDRMFHDLHKSEISTKEDLPSNTGHGSHEWFGLVRLAAELSKKSLLTPRIAIDIISALLLSPPNNKRAKALVTFLTIAGKHFENSAISNQKGELEDFFCGFQNLSNNPAIDPDLRSEIQVGNPVFVVDIDFAMSN